MRTSEPPAARRYSDRRRTAHRRTARRATAAALGVALVAALAATAAKAAPPGPAAPAGGERDAVQEDFNGDGFQDLAIGAPGAAAGPGSEGYVTVFYGTPTGLDRDNAVTVSQATEGVPGEPAPGNRFGSRLVAADLDGDGYTDLAVHVPGADQVTLLWGGATGINGRGSTLIEADGPGGRDVGSQLTTGDFDGDGSPDLLLGRGASGGGQGVYSVLRGPFTREAGGWAEEQELRLTSGDSEVLTVAAGDVTGDGRDDLVVFQSFEEMARDGLFFTGGPDGLERQEGTLPKGAAGAIGDFDGDGFGDLAYREVPQGVVENLPYDPGTVVVRYGTAEGLGSRTQTFTQETPGVPGTDERGDQFGAGLSAGDVTGDGRDDLAVAVPFEAIGDEAEAGAVVLLRGGADGLTGTGAQAWHQDSAGIPGVAEAGDRFGAAVRLLDVTGDGRADLVAGAPQEAIGDTADGGAIWFLPGTGSGLTATGSRAVNPTDLGSALPGVRFGATLSNSGYAPQWGLN